MNSSTSDIIFKGTLLKDDKNIEIQCIYASIASLFVKFINGREYQKGTEFQNCNILIKGKVFNFGNCQFLPEKTIPQFDGRLIFTENTYDFHSTINNVKLLDMQAYFQGLPLMLEQKNNITPMFRNYLTDLSFDLSIYKKIFDDIDFKYRHEPQEVFDSVQQAVIKSEGKNFFKFFDLKLDELKSIATDFSREENSLHGYYLRRQLWNIISSSKFILRSNVRPRGYPGDSMMMSMIYENNYKGDTTFGKLMHYHPLQTRTAQAVRNRRYIIPERLRKIEQNPGNHNEKFRVLSVACGPATELENLITSPDDFDRFKFTLLDQDQEALYEASLNIQKIETRFGRKIDNNLICNSVRTMISVKDLPKKWGHYHFIYSMGLFDYISARVASVIIKKLYELLEPGGTMLIGNFHTRNESRIYMEYWLDWALNHRTEEEFLDLAKDLPGADNDIFYEDTGNQMFLKIVKQTV